MTLAQALAAAAAALIVAIGPQGLSTASAQVEAAMDRASIRAAVGELADLMERNYVFPQAARDYAEHLRARAAAGAYDGLTEQALAQTLEADLRDTHQDAHLRISLAEPESAGPPRVRGGPRGDAISDVTWLADGVGYFRINGLPSTNESVAQMTRALDQLANAQTLILDLRRCPGGALREMDVLFSRLYAAPTRVMIMDTRNDAAAPNPEDISPNLRRVSAPAGVTRDEHWAQPTSPASPLSNARVFVLTGDTGSACEHLAQALRETGRATLIGTRTGGAGHYGGERRFGGRFSVFLPVGNSYAPGAQSWETVGVQPHRNVPMEEALNEALREIGAPASAATHVPAIESNRIVVAGAPPTRRYGIMMEVTDGRPSSFIRVEGVEGIAAAAGLREGDRIVAVNGRPVSEMRPETLTPAMRGSPLTLDIERNGARERVAMSLD